MLKHKTHYSIGELCDEFSVTARALRFYEDEALIAP
ncbi:MAG TPA: MerR family DNA-binding transcriptional regulator, partial [Sphingomicrobium sp.]|nr:MerR family DNA-binding transcriptional regulator [Sphingomicrobium sp.]